MDNTFIPNGNTNFLYSGSHKNKEQFDHVALIIPQQKYSSLSRQKPLKELCLRDYYNA